MDIKAYVDRQKEIEEPSARIIVTGKLHPSADSYDIQLFCKWAKMSIREGTDRIRVVIGGTPNTWVVTILDKKES